MAAIGAVTLLGAGKMGAALLEGWFAQGALGPRAGGASVQVVDPAPSAALVALAAAHGAALNPPDAGPADILVLAIKPQALDAAAPQIARLAGPQTLVLSILAGKSVADLAQRAPGVRAFVRAMPNTPAAIGRGVTGAFASAAVTPAQRAAAETLLKAVGGLVWVEDEGLIDAVTAVSGSGPAYVFLLAETLADAGRAAGLPADVAATLARATVEGAGELLRRTPSRSPADLRENVTSPGGTTAAALAVLMAPDGLAPLMRRAVAAAADRGRALSG